MCRDVLLVPDPLAAGERDGFLRSLTCKKAHGTVDLFCGAGQSNGSCKYLVETPATGPSADTRKLTALPSRFAPETLRLRFGLKVSAIGFQFRFGWTTP